MDEPVVPGCVIRARLIGALQAKQKKNGKHKWTRNDRLIAVARHAQTHQDIHSLRDLRPHLLDEITGFFVEYNQLRQRNFKPLDYCGPKTGRLAPDWRRLSMDPAGALPNLKGSLWK